MPHKSIGKDSISRTRLASLISRINLSPRFACSFLLLISLVSAASTTLAADLDETRLLFWSGSYDQCIEQAKEQVDAGTWNEGWSQLLIQSYLATGKYEEALACYESVLDRYSTSISLRLLGVDVYRYNNQPTKAIRELDAIPEMVQRTPWRYTTREQLIPLGKYFLAVGEDARKILEQCYDRALKQDPKLVDAHIASAELALEKEDASVATKSLEKAIQLEANNPAIHYLTARAWENSNSEKATAALQQALKLNPKHVDSLLLAAELRIDAEDYPEAEKLLDRIQEVNPHHPKLWSLRAVIAHLKGKFEAEGIARKLALAKWPLNPEVDHLIGRKLSQHYLFREGVQYQRRALQMQADYLPAKAQLAQDLLRLGQTDEGWTLVAEVRQRDSYNITAFNLRQLQEHLDKFRSLEAPGFVVRMESREADLYGARVLALLSEARQTLVEKYQAKLEEPIYVEIFPQQSDFAIRTFGMPGGEGFLGVCFGRLITANSPASQAASPTNWQSVLWHEYCHVVTLQKSQNRMPRWLSEGISVYEETLRKKAWGMPMDDTYRAMILGEPLPTAPQTNRRSPEAPASPDDKGADGVKKNQTLLKPLSKMSSAFLDARSPMELQFAYFQSSLAVQFLVERFGIEALQKILDSLATGLSVQDSIQRHAGPLEQLDLEFIAYAKNLATQWAPQADHSDIELPPIDDIEAWTALIKDHPNNVKAIQTAASLLIRAKQFDRAIPLLDRWLELMPEDASAGGVYAMRAKVFRELKQPDQERKSLVELVARNADAINAFERLIELDQSSGDWTSILNWTEEILAVTPFQSSVYSTRAKAAESLGDAKIAAESWEGILQLDPIDPALAHLQLAKARLENHEYDAAKRQVLLAIEESPRYREAFELLSKIRMTEQGVTVLAPEFDIGPPEPPLESRP